MQYSNVDVNFSVNNFQRPYERIRREKTRISCKMLEKFLEKKCKMLEKSLEKKWYLETDVSAVFLHQSQHGGHQRRFSCADLPDNRHQLPLLDIDIDVFETRRVFLAPWEWAIGDFHGRRDAPIARWNYPHHIRVQFFVAEKFRQPIQGDFRLHVEQNLQFQSFKFMHAQEDFGVNLTEEKVYLHNRNDHHGK